MWTDDEIVRYYNEAKDKKAIISIIAQLNAVSSNTIVRILCNNGIDVSSQLKKRRGALYLVSESGDEISIDEAASLMRRSRQTVYGRVWERGYVVIDGIEYRARNWKGNKVEQDG